MLITLALLAAPSAHAFTEDVCYGGLPLVRNCYEAPTDPDCPPGDRGSDCKAQAVADVAVMLTSDGRSMIHLDATYLLAQAVGFDALEAHTVAAYDEAADTRQYLPRNQAGLPLYHAQGSGAVDPAACVGNPASHPACPYITIDVGALNRLDLDSSGAVLHYGATFNPTGAAPYVDGSTLDPANLDAHEVPLAHWRAWAYGASNLCAAGITADMSSDPPAAPCDDHTLRGRLPILGTADEGQGVPITVDLGEQVFRDPSTGDPGLTASGFDAAAGAHADLARFGLYLHFLQDRTSHLWCHDMSRIDGPIGFTARWDLEYDVPACNAPEHAMQHAWEVGFATTEGGADPVLKALEDTASELADFTSANLATRATLALLVDDLDDALATPVAEDRIAAFNAIADAYGLCRLPGHGNTDPDCPE